MFEKTFKRTFIHVDDMAESIIYAIENYDSMKNNTFNVGGDFNNYNKEEIALLRQQVKLRFNQLRKKAKKIGLDFISIANNEDFVEPLLKLFRMREKR